MAIRGSGSCTLLTLTPSIRVKRGIAIFATLSPPRNDSTVNWVDATSGFFEKDSRPIMLFDGVCNLCNGGVRFVRDNDRNRTTVLEFVHKLSSELVMKDLGHSHFIVGIDVHSTRRIRYEALQSKAGRKLLRRSGRAPDDISSVVLVERDRSHIKSEAVLKIMEYIDLPFPQLAFFLKFVPLFLRDFVYDNVANNRYTIFGRSESCEIYYD